MTINTSTPLIIDDDGSQDGMTAIAYMLANPEFDVQAITISNGIARPEVFDDNVLRMLDRLGDLDVPVGVGRSSPLEGSNEFPDFIRDASDTFWSPTVSLPEETPDVETQDAVDLIDETNLPAAANTITDFSTTEGDVLGLANTNLSFEDLEFVADGDNTIVRAFNTDLAILIGSETTQIGESDLVFV